MRPSQDILAGDEASNPNIDMDVEAFAVEDIVAHSQLYKGAGYAALAASSSRIPAGSLSVTTVETGSAGTHADSGMGLT